MCLAMIFFSVQKSNAQITVTITFDPPNPVPSGVTTFRCDFEIGNLNSVFAEFTHAISHIVTHISAHLDDDAENLPK